MPGWESLFRITPATAWGTPGTTGNRGYFLYADRDSLSMGAQVVERDTKIIGVRESPLDTFTVDRYFPRGDITFQSRVDDLLMILMAHFQNVVKSGVGTYEFFRIDAPLGWSGGSQFRIGTIVSSVGTLGTGTDAYSINIDKFLGTSIIDTAVGTQANGIRFTNGIVDQLKFGVRYTEDFVCVPTIKFLAGSYFRFPSNFKYPTVYGSLSEFSRFVDYQGTVTITGEDFNIENWDCMFSNNTADRARIGKRGYNRFPLAGKWVADGSFDMELSRDLIAMQEGSTNALTINMFVAAGNMIQVSQPNIYWRAFDIPVADGAQLLDLSRPYRAYPPSGTTGPSTIVRVYTGSNYSSTLLGF